MLDVNKKALHSYPSLLPLQKALIAAESESPSRPPHIDANEQRAVQLIQKMRAEYKRPLPLLNWSDIPSQHGLHISLHEMTATHVG